MIDYFEYAENRGIDIYYDNIPQCKSIALSNCICLDASLTFGGAEERTRAVHEIAHVETGAFYSRDTSCSLRALSECRANRKSYQIAVPWSDLANDVHSGYTEPCELAERFGVTEGFMRNAIAYYLGPCGYSF